MMSKNRSTKFNRSKSSKAGRSGGKAALAANVTQPGSSSKEVGMASCPGSEASGLDGWSPTKSPKVPFIGYVHNLFPLKRNRRDTMNFSTLVLQTAEGRLQEALCFSGAKRRLLEEKQSNRTAVKLVTYTSTADRKKFVINTG